MNRKKKVAPFPVSADMMARLDDEAERVGASRVGLIRTLIDEALRGREAARVAVRAARVTLDETA